MEIFVIRRADLHGGLTHPDCATLVGPLSAVRKEGFNNTEKFKEPSLWLAIERVVERSDDRVSHRRPATMVPNLKKPLFALLFGGLVTLIFKPIAVIYLCYHD